MNNTNMSIYSILKDLVLLRKIYKSVLWNSSSLHGEHLLDERHTVHESHLSSEQLHQHF